MPNLSVSFLLASALNFLQISVSLFSNFVVLQNFVFTFYALSISDIPYYDIAGNTSQTFRLNFEWWQWGSDLLWFFPPLLLLNQLILINSFKFKNNIFYIITMVILLLLDVAKLVYRGYWYIYCASYQFCRNYDILVNPSNANPDFQIGVWTNFVIVILDIAYILIGIYFNNFGKKKQKKAEEVELLKTS